MLRVVVCDCGLGCGCFCVDESVGATGWELATLDTAVGILDLVVHIDPKDRVWILTNCHDVTLFRDGQFEDCVDVFAWHRQRVTLSNREGGDGKG